MNKEEKISVLIVDDELPARNLLKIFLKEYSEFVVTAEAENGFEAVKLINEHKPHVVFMDIKMPKLDGFEVLELLDSLPVLVFSTAYDEFALKAFEKNAVDYLLKPYSKERFSIALQKVKEKILNIKQQQKSAEGIFSLKQEMRTPLNRIVLKQNAKILILSTDEITHFEAQDDYVFVHTSTARYLKHERMKYLEENLKSTDFLRVHRSFIVNLNYIDKIEIYEKDRFCILLKNKKLVKVSKAGYKKLKSSLGI